MRRALAPVGLVAAFAAAAALGGSAQTWNGQSLSPAEPGPGDAPSPRELEVAPTPSLSLAFESPGLPVGYGDSVSLTGELEPAETGREIVIELDSGAGWVEALRTTTGLDGGGFAAVVFATRSSLVRARTVEGAVVSASATLTVTPRVAAKPARGLAYGIARVAARVEPAGYSGLVGIVVKKKGEEVARSTAQVSNGRLRTNVPLPGIGRFTLELGFPKLEGLEATVVTARAVAKGRTLSVGSSGRDVRGLRERLAALRFHVPAPSTTFSYELADALIAFQKTYRLERTGTVDPATWRALERAAVLRPRHQGPAVHIEVDKTRQILMVVRDGQVSAVLPVSSGATGNTPEGKHEIRWKALATTTWLGPGILYRTMTFYENSVAIHGWSSVPSYPASHGCVRIPIWSADWLYNQSHVGETVYVYA